MLRIVRTEYGLVEGIPAADPRITAFKGIPFAKPPVGELRWRAPQPPEPWEGVRDCARFGPIAMQDKPGNDPSQLYDREWHVDPDIPMSEDCLYLNVWTPARTGDEKLPVMYWIFGGAFNCGYPAEMEFDGERIARRGVVLVSVNYRVGVFGFLARPELSAEDPDGCCGNYGLQDQAFGLKWVRNNIASFGGDPDNVTIFGQSAGGGSVISLLTSPLVREQKLFSKAIFQSGGGLRKYGQGSGMIPLEKALENGRDFFAANGLSGLAEARAVPAEEMFRMGRAFGYMDKWSPCVDGRFLPEDPSDALAGDRYPDIPLLYGCTGGEYEFHRIPGTPGNREELEAFARAKFCDEADDFLALADKSQGDGSPALSPDERAKELGLHDDTFKGRFMNNYLFLVSRVAHGRSGSYMYYFNASMPGFDHPGAFHSSELWFVFETLAKCWRPFTGRHYDLARIMCNYWTNFARAGDPNGPDADGTPMPEWKPADGDSHYIQYLNEDYIGEYRNYRTPLVEFATKHILGKIQ